MRPPSEGEAQQAVPRRLMELRERASAAGLDGEGIQAWWEWEATRWRVPVDLSAAELRETVERGTGLIKRECHGTQPEDEGPTR